MEKPPPQKEGSDMHILKEYSCRHADGSARITFFQLDPSGLFYAIYGNDEYAIPVVGWGIDGSSASHIAPLVLHSEFGLVPAWAFSIRGSQFKGIVTRSDL
jgi:hypothetical protein